MFIFLFSVFIYLLICVFLFFDIFQSLDLLDDDLETRLLVIDVLLKLSQNSGISSQKKKQKKHQAVKP